MAEIIVFSIFIITFVGLLFDNIRLKAKNSKLYVDLVSSKADNLIITDYFKNSYQDIKDQELQSKDDFVKFLSESRDWAFLYIEQVQEGLQAFVRDAGPAIEYWDRYQAPISFESHMEVISKAYKEIQKLLPEVPSDIIE
jgi:hypothetical protein